MFAWNWIIKIPSTSETRLFCFATHYFVSLSVEDLLNPEGGAGGPGGGLDLATLIMMGGGAAGMGMGMGGMSGGMTVEQMMASGAAGGVGMVLDPATMAALGYSMNGMGGSSTFDPSAYMLGGTMPGVTEQGSGGSGFIGQGQGGYGFVGGFNNYGVYCGVVNTGKFIIAFCSFLLS